MLTDRSRTDTPAIEKSRVRPLHYSDRKHKRRWSLVHVHQHGESNPNHQDCHGVLPLDYAGKNSSLRGDRTHDHPLIRRTLCQLS